MALAYSASAMRSPAAPARDTQLASSRSGSLAGTRLPHAAARRAPLTAAATRTVVVQASSRKAGVVKAASTFSDALTGADAKRTELKEKLLVVTSGGLGVTNEKRVDVSELLPKLEALNPTPSPTTSEDLNGTWQFLYTGGITPGFVPSPTRPIALLMYAGGFTIGQFGLEVAGMLPDNVVNIKDFFLKISPDQPRGEASVNFRLMNSAQNLKVRTTLQMESDVRMKETYSEMEAVNRTVPLPEPLKFERQIFITYLDDDILVARDATGSPDILVRREVYDESEPWVAPEEVDVDDKIYVTDSSDEGTD